MKRVRAASLLVLFGAWLFFAVAFVAVGPNDVEDFYTGVASTKFPSTPLPRLANCGDDRFLCADFAAAEIERDPVPMR